VWSNWGRRLGRSL